MKGFIGYHSEWNLGSPGGWDYQRITQVIGKEVWRLINDIKKIEVKLDFDHPLLYPVEGFVEMLADACRKRAGAEQGLIAVVAEEETLEDVTENRNLAERISAVDGLTGALMAPQELELQAGRVCWRGRPVSLIFVDFNTDVLLNLHRKHDLAPLLQAVKEGRVLNPRGTEPINVKSMFEVLTGPDRQRFHPEVVQRTPWTRRFFERETIGPKGEPISNLVEWTFKNWDDLVLKPERGYSGKGVKVGGVGGSAQEAIELALREKNYIVQEKIPLHIWAEEIPALNMETQEIHNQRCQTDFRCLMGPKGVFGFLCRYGGVPTNVGSGGGVQPLAILRSADTSVREAVQLINEAILNMSFDQVAGVVEKQKTMALDHDFTYLLGPIKIALRPRIITEAHLNALGDYCAAVWKDCITLEKMWLAGELDEFIQIEEEELEIARWQPWGGSDAIIASDGLFNFGANPEPL